MKNLNTVKKKNPQSQLGFCELKCFPNYVGSKCVITTLIDISMTVPPIPISSRYPNKRKSSDNMSHKAISSP